MLLSGEVPQAGRSYSPSRLLPPPPPLRSPRQSTPLRQAYTPDAQTHRHSVAVPERRAGVLGALTQKYDEPLEWYEGIRGVTQSRTFASHHAGERPRVNALKRDEPSRPRIGVLQGTSDDTLARSSSGVALAQENAARAVFAEGEVRVCTSMIFQVRQA